MIEIKEGSELDKAVRDVVEPTHKGITLPCKWSVEPNWAQRMIDWLMIHHKYTDATIPFASDSPEVTVKCWGNGEEFEYKARTINLALCKAVLDTNERLTDGD